MLYPRRFTLLASLLSALLLTSCEPVAKIDATYDLVVYGGTPSGAVAAKTAADEGLSVALVSPWESVSGMMGNGLSASDIGFWNAVSGEARTFFETSREAFKAESVAPYRHTPQFAEGYFTDLLETSGVTVYRKTRLETVRKETAEIRSLVFDKIHLGGSRFIDATYEGDLMAAAGVDHIIGRESASQYGETLAGVTEPDVIFDDRTPEPMAPSPFLSSNYVQMELGSADDRVMASTFRLCLTDDPDKRELISAPPNYRAEDFDFIAKKVDFPVEDYDYPDGLRLGWFHNPKGKGQGYLSGLYNLSTIPGGMYDLNANNGYGVINLPGFAESYLVAEWGDREKEVERLRYYVQGLIYTLQTSPAVSELYRDVQNTYREYGLCKGVFKGKDWPEVPYLREGRRMIGGTVLTQQDIFDNRTKTDAIFVGSYHIDLKETQYLTDGLNLLAEGKAYSPVPLYDVPYSAILPNAEQASNLLVTGTPSVSHVAWGSLRMEPELVMLGEAAGVAASISLAADTSVQNIEVQTLQNALRERGFEVEVTDICDNRIHRNFHDSLRRYRGLDMSTCDLTPFERRKFNQIGSVMDQYLKK